MESQSIFRLSVDGAEDIPLTIQQGEWLLSQYPQLGRWYGQAKARGGSVVVIDEDVIEVARARFGL